MITHNYGCCHIHNDTNHLQNIDRDQFYFLVVRGRRALSRTFFGKTRCHQNLRSALHPPPDCLYAHAVWSLVWYLEMVWPIGVTKETLSSWRSLHKELISSFIERGMRYILLYVWTVLAACLIAKHISCVSSLCLGLYFVLFINFLKPLCVNEGNLYFPSVRKLLKHTTMASCERLDTIPVHIFPIFWPSFLIL